MAVFAVVLSNAGWRGPLSGLPVDCSLFPDGVVMSGMPSWSGNGRAIVSDHEQQRDRLRRVLLCNISWGGPPSSSASTVLPGLEQLILIFVSSYVDGLLCEHIFQSPVPLQIQEATPIANQQSWSSPTFRALQ